MGFVPLTVGIGLVIGLLLNEGDNGYALVLVLVTSWMVIVAGANLSQLGAMIGIASIVGLMIVLTGPIGLQSSDGTHGRELVQALRSGGWQGIGLGQSGLLEPVEGGYREGIFATIGQELGFLGMMGIVLAFSYLAFRGLRVAINARDYFGHYLATGLVAALVVQALWNMAFVTRITPMASVPLPFLSFDQAGVVLMSGLIGVVLSISRGDYVLHERALGVSEGWTWRRGLAVVLALIAAMALLQVMSPGAPF